MGIQNINAEQAKQILDTDSAAVYIDVRTEREFDNGHVPNAVNIPVGWPDPMTRQMKPNADFVSVVAAHFSKNKRIIVGCQMGGRSQMAAQLLGQEGFEDVSNMQGGFGGARDPMGRVVAAGWSQLGYPVEMNVPKGASYEEMARSGGPDVPKLKEDSR
jgi:rhodanese-related sulfurtransferase